jgi:hypothetical protein
MWRLAKYEQSLFDFGRNGHAQLAPVSWMLQYHQQSESPSWVLIVARERTLGQWVQSCLFRQGLFTGWDGERGM